MKSLKIISIAFMVAFAAAFSVSAQTDAAPVVVQEGSAAPAFTLTTTDGRKITLADYKKKALILNFWATWCPPCRSELPEMNRLAARLAQTSGAKLSFLAICVSDEQLTMKAFLKQNKYTFTCGLDTDNLIAAAYNIEALPTTLLISPEGKIERIHVGMMTKEQLADFISAYDK